MQDRQLLRDYIAHASQTAFAQLVERHLPLVYSTCLLEVHDSSLAEDVTQVVFLILARKAPSLQDHISLAGWLYRTARFACRNALRQEARRKRVEQKAAEAMREYPQEDSSWESLTPMLRPALSSLNAKEQEVVLLRFFEDRSVRETSLQLGISEAATKMRASRAIEKLRRYFARQGMVLSTAALLGLLSSRTSHAVPEACKAAVMHAASTLLAGQMSALPAGSSLDTLTKGVFKAMGMNKIYVSLVIICASFLLIGGPVSFLVKQSSGASSETKQTPLPSGAVVDRSLTEDSRLQQKVAIQAEGVPLGDLLALLQKKTGIGMAADEKTADDKIIVFGPARPLREVMADMATLFNDTWVHSQKGNQHTYRLIRTVRAQEYEDSLANNTLNLMLAQLDAYVKAANETPEQLAMRPADDPIKQHLLNHEQRRIAARIFGMLSPEQRAKLLTRKRLNIPFDTLTPAQKEVITQDYDAIMTDGEKNDGFHRPAEGVDKTGLIFTVQSIGDISAAGSLTVYLSFFSSTVIYAVDFARVESRSHWLLPPHGDPYSRAKMSDQAVLPGRDSIQAAQAEMQGNWIDHLKKLAETSGTPLMADYYRSRPVARPVDDPFPAAAGATTITSLDQFCKSDGYLWWPRDKTLLFRKRNWYTQRQYEIPDRWLRSMIQNLKAQNYVPTYADVMQLADLTTAQMAGMRMNGVGNEDGSENGVGTDQSFLSGLSELLAILKLKPTGNGTSGLIPPTEEQGRNKLTYEQLTPTQRQLLPAFVEAQEKPVSLSDGAIQKFNVWLTSRRSQQPGQEPVSVVIGWDLSHFNVYAVSLPVMLPDDRTDRTRIEILSQ